MSTFVGVGVERLPWVSHLPPDLISRRQARRIPSHYDASIPARIADADFTISTDLASRMEEALHAIMVLDVSMTSAFDANPVAPLASVLLRTESASSSQIEHVTVSSRQLAIAEIGLSASTNANLVVGNVAAMRAAIDLADRLDEAAILTMHAALMEATPHAKPGRWRDTQVWIGASDFSPADAAFVPPSAERVPCAMADLNRFLQRADLPIIAHIALSHAQFETVHPFVDGNGRTGRALMHAMLRASGLVGHVTVPISAGLLSHIAEYVDALTAYRSGDPDPIIETVTDATWRATVLGTWLLSQLKDLVASWRDRVRPRAGSALASLIPALVSQPAVTIETVVDTLHVSSTAARRAIDQAGAAGILTPSSDKKRNRVWLASEVLTLLDDFAIRAGRRLLT
ncbi:MAG: Fic family protein [Propionibacteriaceae bacterium]|jgi:Fic family protein|nr:Fic family protein [Propionibacteriaceae bacterium]